MGCNCGKKARDFKNLVQQAQTVPQPTLPQSNLSPAPSLPPSTPAQHVTRDERIRLRAQRMAERAAGIESRRIAREARIKTRIEVAAKEIKLRMHGRR